MTHIIIGSGPAGIHAAEAIRSIKPQVGITMITKDPIVGLSPVMLTYWVGGDARRADICFRPSDWPDRTGVTVYSNSAVDRIDIAKRQVVLENDKQLSFERLLIATGSSAALLPIPGVEAQGVGFFRTLSDAETFLKGGPELKEAVIIGGGFIGMKLACHLRKKRLAVTILEKEDRLAARVLDLASSKMIAHHLKTNGIEVKTGVTVAGIHQKDDWVSAVSLSDGQRFEAQRVVLSVGVRPNIDFLSGTGLEAKAGILVDDRMQTRMDRIYSAGDVAITRDSIIEEPINNATWPAAARQGAVAGSNMADVTKRYVHNFPVNALDLLGLRVMTAGYPNPEKTVSYDSDTKRDRPGYQRRFYRGGSPVGFILIGDISGAGQLLSEIKRSSIFRRSRQQAFSTDGIRIPGGYAYEHGNFF